MIMIKVIPESHVDHGIPRAVLAWALGHLAETLGADALGRVTVTTLEIPRSLPRVPCALYGPATGYGPVPDSVAFYRRRGNRPGESRVICAAPHPDRRLTVVVGPVDDVAGLVLYTAYGGPQAPREPWDPSLDEAGRAEAEAFWSEHALAVEAS